MTPDDAALRAATTPVTASLVGEEPGHVEELLAGALIASYGHYADEGVPATAIIRAEDVMRRLHEAGYTIVLAASEPPTPDSEALWTDLKRENDMLRRMYAEAVAAPPVEPVDTGLRLTGAEADAALFCIDLTQAGEDSFEDGRQAAAAERAASKISTHRSLLATGSEAAPEPR